MNRNVRDRPIAPSCWQSKEQMTNENMTQQIRNGGSGSIGEGRIDTRGAGALEEDLLGGDHGEPGAGVLLEGVAELGPLAALDGAAGEARLGELADTGGGGHLDLVAVVVEAVLDDLLEAVLVGPHDDAGREEEVEVAAVVLVELSPPDLLLRRRRHGACARVSGGRSAARRGRGV